MNLYNLFIRFESFLSKVNTFVPRISAFAINKQSTKSKEDVENIERAEVTTSLVLGKS